MRQQLRGKTHPEYGKHHPIGLGSILTDSKGQQSANIFCKGSDYKCFYLPRHSDSVTTILLHCYGIKTAIGNMEMSGCDYVPIKLNKSRLWTRFDPRAIVLRTPVVDTLDKGKVKNTKSNKEAVIDFHLVLLYGLFPLSYSLFSE
jgi:hypothetical protein